MKAKENIEFIEVAEYLINVNSLDAIYYDGFYYTYLINGKHLETFTKTIPKKISDFIKNNSDFISANKVCVRKDKIAYIDTELYHIYINASVNSNSITHFDTNVGTLNKLKKQIDKNVLK